MLTGAVVSFYPTTGLQAPSAALKWPFNAVERRDDVPVGIDEFKRTGLSIEAVLDRLLTAEIVGQDAEGWTIKAEVFGKGIEMWLRSQGDYIQREGGSV